MLKAYEKTKESADVKGNIEAKSLATVEREREREREREQHIIKQSNSECTRVIKLNKEEVSYIINNSNRH